MHVSAFSSGVSEPARRPIKSCCQVVAPLRSGRAPHWLSKPDILGNCLSGAGLKGWGAQCGVWIFTPQEEVLGFSVTFRLCVAVLRVGFMERLGPSFYPLQCVLFLIYLMERIAWLVFKSILEEIVPYIAMDSGWLWEVSSGYSYVHNLESPLLFLNIFWMN